MGRDFAKRSYTASDAGRHCRDAREFAEGADTKLFRGPSLSEALD
jgi:hypothetical protein